MPGRRPQKPHHIDITRAAERRKVVMNPHQQRVASIQASRKAEVDAFVESGSQLRSNAATRLAEAATAEVELAKLMAARATMRVDAALHKAAMVRQTDLDRDPPAWYKPRRAN
jgi:hypothetical protein